MTEIPPVTVSQKVVNKGTGAGGSNTNETGLSFENDTDLSKDVKVIIQFSKDSIYGGYSLTFIKGNKINNINGKKLLTGTKSSLKKFCEKNGLINPDVKELHGTKQPDEWYLNIETFDLYIIEKKFQQSSGSVVEKLQTAHVKREHYQKKYPKFSIKYTYCLSDWFRHHCPGEIELLKEWGISVFWGEESEYFDKIKEIF